MKSRPIGGSEVQAGEVASNGTELPAVPKPGEELPLAQIIYPYGVGIDTHSKFIAVCVLLNRAGKVLRLEKNFQTSWKDLLTGAAWVKAQLGRLASGPDGVRYCIESTGVYHLPVLRAFGGSPSVVNPLLAGPTRRKTDVLDARLLAYHSLTGVWPKSFLPSAQAQVLRVIWAQRQDEMRRATRCGNRINNVILRFGHTIAVENPIRSAAGESLVEDLVEGRKPASARFCPDGLPLEARPVVAELLADMRQAAKRVRWWQRQCVQYVAARSWPKWEGQLAGAELLDILKSVPGVGDSTALWWLSEVTDPRRFEQSKQVAAYCGCDPSLKVSAGKVTDHVRRRGNTRLHWALTKAAAPLVNRRQEAFGQWGASIAGRHKKGGWRKAVGAVARRIATSLWQVHGRGEPFTYAGYFKEPQTAVPRVAIDQMGLGRGAAALTEAGYTDSAGVIQAYQAGGLASLRGVGVGTLALIKAWQLGHQVKAGGLASTTDYFLVPTHLAFKERANQPKPGSNQLCLTKRKLSTATETD